MLDTSVAGGDPVSTSSVALPAGVSASIDSSLTGAFQARALLSGEAYVSWEYRSRPARGMPEAGGTAGQAPQNIKSAASNSGLVRLSLQTGRAETIAPEDLPAALQDAAPRLVMASGQPGTPQLMLSVDGRFGLWTERIADDSVFEKHQWTIIDQGTGEAVGRMRSHVARAPFVVIDSTLIYQTGPYVLNTDAGLQATPLELRAIDLGTGERAWSRPMRDTTYRRPSPP